MQRRQFIATAGAGGVGAAALSTPAIAQSRVEMNIVSSWPRDFPGLGTSSQRLAERITKVSDGRIVTQYYAAGERVGAFDVFEEVASGNSQAYNSAEYYFKGKHPAFGFFTAVPFGLTYTEQQAWLKFRGGQELWDELSGQFGLKALSCGSTGCQMGGWFRKEIDSADDFKGLKMRIPGFGGEALSKLGASPVSLPGGQIYENLASGAIDATEWVGPYNDYFMRFFESARFYYAPGFHEPGGNSAFGMNKSWWEGLGDFERAVIETCCNEETAMMMDELNALNGVYLQKMIDEHGVTLRTFSDDIYDSFGEASAEVLEEVRQHDELTNRVFENWSEARTVIATWLSNADTGFSSKRNAVLGIG